MNPCRYGLMSLASLLIALLQPVPVMALTMDEVIMAAEEKIATQQHWDIAALNLNVDKSLVGRDDLDLMEVTLLPNGRIAKVKVIASDGEHTMSGSCDRAVLLPMALHSIERGEVIAEADVQMLKWQARQQGKHHISSMDEVIGQQAAHRISPYRPIRTNDLQEQIVMQKGKQVNVEFHKSGLNITGHAEALEAGAIGKRIRLRNIDSQKVITGVIKDADTVEVAR